MDKDYSAKELQELAGVSEGNVCTHQKEYRGKTSGGIHNWWKCGSGLHVGNCPLNNWKSEWAKRLEANEQEYVF